MITHGVSLASVYDSVWGVVDAINMNKELVAVGKAVPNKPRMNT